MDKILHHLETKGNHCLKGNNQSRVSEVVQDFVHSQYNKGSLLGDPFFHVQVVYCLAVM